jgi:O-antigen ligase
MISKKNKLTKTPLNLPIMLFLIATILNVKFIRTSLELKRILCYMIFVLSYFISVNIINNREKLDKLLNIIYITTFIGSFYSLYTFLYRPFRGGNYRGYGMFLNPNALGEYMLLIVPIITYYAITRKNPFYKIGLLPIYMAFLSSLSRTSIAATIISFVVINTFFKRSYWYFIGSLILTVLIVLYPPVNARLTNVLNMSDHSLLARITLWGNAISDFKTSPLFGIGTGGFLGSAIPYDSKIFNSSFNMFLTILTENGIIGFLLYLWITVLIIGNSIKLYFKIKDEYIKNICLAILMSAIAFQILSMAEDPTVAIMANWAFGIIIGILYAIWSDYNYENLNNFSYVGNNRI